MNCQNCGFYCYDDEYICPNCEALLERELPTDEYERSSFIHNKITQFNIRKRALEIVKSRKIIFIAVFLIQIIWGLYLSTFVVYRFPARNNYVIARYSIVFAFAFYIILLGKPEMPSGKDYVEIRKPKGLINKGSIKKSTYLIIIFFIFVLTCLFYIFYLKNLFLSDIIRRQSPKLKIFGIDKLGFIIDLRFFIHVLGVSIFYVIHPIFNITDADYFILKRIDLHKVNKGDQGVF